MKKVVALFFVVSLLSVSAVFAEIGDETKGSHGMQMHEAEMSHKGSHGMHMDESEMSSKGSHGMKGHGSKKADYSKKMLMYKMMKPEVTPTDDGGVVVIVGDTLQKYDKKLKLVGETIIEIDYKAMKERMHKAKQNICPITDKNN